MMICVALASSCMKLNAQNVGIGSTVFTPNYLLHINQSAASGTMFQMTNTTTGTASTDGFQISFNTTGSTFQLNNRESGNISFLTNNVEKFQITSDSGIMLMNPVDYVYHNFSNVKGYPGYGFRSWNGRMQYKHKGGSWADFPTMPNIPGNVEWWIRPTAASYIRPMYNQYIRVYDTLQTYGLYFDGGKNQYGGYFRTTAGLYTPTAAVVGFSDVTGNQTYSYLGYNGDYTFAGQTIAGSGVYAYVDDPARAAGFFRTTSNASVAANINFSNVWMANYNYVTSSRTGYNPNGSYTQLDVNSDIGNYYEAAILSLSQNTGGTGGINVGGRFQADGGNQHAIGVYGWASTDASTTFAYGGYFYAESTNYGTSSYSYIADDWNGRKITGSGTVSEIIPTTSHGRITLTCPESPEYWYIDYGSVTMENGKAHVELDPILIDICIIDDANPIKVMCQPNMEYCNGVAVINKTASGFDIIEMNGGTHNGEIDFQIIAKPKTNFGEGRFPQAKGPSFLYLKGESEMAKTKNIPDRNKIFRWDPDWVVYHYNPEDYVEIGDIIPAGPNAGKIKLGDGKYGTAVPAKKSDLGIGN